MERLFPNQNHPERKEDEVLVAYIRHVNEKREFWSSMFLNDSFRAILCFIGTTPRMRIGTQMRDGAFPLFLSQTVVSKYLN